MFGFLRQSTASQSREIGPFLDDTDFKTPETGLTVANTDIKLSVNGAAGANKNSGGGTHRNNGMYGVTFDATDTATVGELCGSVLVSGALLVVFKFFVIAAKAYDAMTLGPPVIVAKNVAYPNFQFMMTTTDAAGVSSPATGRTVNVTRVIDGGSLAAGTLSSVTEIGVGLYRVDFAAADLNGNCITLRATASGCDDTFERILTAAA